MPRPREFNTGDVVHAAMMTFWEQGYEATSLDDLLERTNIGRSSLYQAFGSKHGLFDAALERYNRVQITVMIGDMEASDDGKAAIIRFLAGMKAQVEHDLPAARRGCLMTNSMTELGADDGDVVRRSREYRVRLAAAFRRSLDNAERLGELGPGDNSPRVRLLAAATIGFFVHLRSSDDPVELCDLLDAIIEQVSAW